VKVSDALAAFNIAKRDAETLLLHCLGRSNRAWLFAHDTDDLAVEDFKQYSALCREREQGVPLAYVLGYREFWSLELSVTPDVLIPRPETEHLVEWAIERVEAFAAPSLLDLGTGSGAIALACKAAQPKLQVTACDVSEPALAVAKKNARNLDLPIELIVFEIGFPPLAIDHGQSLWRIRLMLRVKMSICCKAMCVLNRRSH